MGDKVTIGIRLTADGKELVGAVQLSTSEIEKLGAATRRAGGETESFSAKQASMASNIRSVAQELVGYWAAWKLGETIKEIALLNARYETLGISMNVVGKNAGYNAAQMEDAAAAMQKTGISMIESRQQAMRLVQAHIDLSKATELARIAQDAAVIGNMNSSEAFANMIHGIQTGQTDVLRTIGLNISMEQSYKLMALQLGKNADALTQNEKTQAILNAVMLAGADIAGTYEAAMGTAGKQINSMTRYLEDVKVKSGEVFNELLTVGVMAFTEQLKDANGELDEMSRNQQLAEWGNDLAATMVTLANQTDNYVTVLRMMVSTIVAGGVQVKELLSGNLGGAQAVGQAWQEDMDKLAQGYDRVDRAWDARKAAKAEKQAADLDSTKRHNEQITAIMRFYTDQRVKGLISEADYLKTVAAIQQQEFGDRHQYKDTASTAKDTASESAIKHAQDFIKALKLQDAQLGLDESQKKAVEAATIALTVKSEALRMKIMEAAGAFAAHYAAQQSAIEAEKSQAAAVDALNKKYDEMEMGKSDAIKSTNDYVISLGQGNQQREMEIGLMGQSEIARNIAIGQYQIERDLQAQILKIKVATTDEDERARQISSATDAASRAKDSVAQYVQINEQMKDWNAMWGTVEKTGKDVFVHLLGEGKGAFDGIGKAIKASVIDLLYQLTARKWLINIGASISGSMGIAGAANAAQGGGGSGGMGSLSGMGGWFTDFGGSAGNSIATAGMKLYDAGFTGAGEWMGANAEALGNAANVGGQALGYANALFAARDGQWGKALGSAVGTYFGGPIGGAIGSAIGTWVDGYFGGGGGDKIGSWGDYSASGPMSNVNTPSGGDPIGIARLAADSFARLNTVAAALGTTVDTTLRLNYELDPQGDAPGHIYYGAGGSSIHKQINGQDVTAAASELQAAASRAVLMALQSADMPGYLSSALSAVNAQTASIAEIDATVGFTVALKQMHDQLNETQTPLDIARSNIALLGTTAETYTADFKRAIETGMTPELLDKWKTLGATVAAVADQEKRLNDQRRGMEINLMDLTGNAAGALAARRADELAALDASLRPLQDQINAQTDLGAAYDKASSAMQAMKLLTTDTFATLIDYTRYMRLASNAGISGADAGLPPDAATTFMPGRSGGDANKELVVAVDDLRAELRAGQIALAQYMSETAKILRRWNGDGMPEVRVVV